MNTPNNAAALERLENELREELRNSQYVVELSVEAVSRWADELATLCAALARPDALTRQPSGEAEETEQSIAADCYHWIADCIGTLPGYSVQEHVQTMKETLAACSDFLHDFVPAEEGGCSEAVELAKNCRAVLSGRIDKYEASHPSADAPGVTVDEVLRGVCMRMLTFENSEHVPNVMFQQLRAALAPKPEGE